MPPLALQFLDLGHHSPPPAEPPDAPQEKTPQAVPLHQVQQVQQGPETAATLHPAVGTGGECVSPGPGGGDGGVGYKAIRHGRTRMAASVESWADAGLSKEANKACTDVNKTCTKVRRQQAIAPGGNRQEIEGKVGENTRDRVRRECMLSTPAYARQLRRELPEQGSVASMNFVANTDDGHERLFTATHVSDDISSEEQVDAEVCRRLGFARNLRRAGG